MSSAIRFAIVAGEDSGDILGASLIQALKRRFPLASFEGIGGRRMIESGCQSLYPLERLSVMGLWEPLKRLPEILRIRKNLRQRFIQQQPDVFIGIDAPDFNLSLAQSLKAEGIKTAHYVSPTVWAWRQGRIKKIKKAVDLMLALFPFETKIYQDHHIPICCVGHPLADKIPEITDKYLARQTLQLPLTSKVVALLPGSRAQELTYLAKEFIKTAQWLQNEDPTLHFISACVNEEREAQFQTYLKEAPSLKVTLFKGQATAVMAAADVILLASGTASLEAMLVKRPTVVAYKMSPLTYAIAKRIIKVPYIALPNLLAGKCLMPEFIQSEVKAEKMGKTLLYYLNNPEAAADLMPDFTKIHCLLKRNAGEMAAGAIEKLINNHTLK